MSWTRRHFLRAAGITSGAGLLSALIPRPVAAADGEAKRIVFLNNAQGTDMLSWAPPGTPDGLPLDDEMSYQLAPLADYKSNLLVINGLDSAGATRRGISGLQQHTGHEAVAALLTGRPVEVEAGTQAQGPSVDQVIGTRLAAAAMDRGEEPTRYPVLRISRPAKWSNGNPPQPDTAGSRGSVHAFYWLEAGLSAPMYQGPWEAYGEIFGDLSASADELARIRLERRSVLDSVRGELRRVRAELPDVDRDYLDRHLDAIRGIETDLDSMVSCSPTALPDGTAIQGMGRYNDGEHEDLVNSVTLRLIAACLSCGLTQVACHHSQFQEGTQNVLGHLDEYRDRYEGKNMVLHSTAHAMVAGRHPVDGYFSEEVADNARRFWADMYRWRADSMKKYLLDALPEPVRDNTLVFWGSEMSEGANHSGHSVPTTVFQGNAIEHFDAGKAYTFDTAYHPIDNPRAYDGWGRPNNLLLASLCHAMGLEEIEHFGDEGYPSGGLTQVVR